jgi:hypothetical protein
VTRAVIPETARICDWILGLRWDYVFLYCRPLLSFYQIYPSSLRFSGI